MSGHDFQEPVSVQEGSVHASHAVPDGSENIFTVIANRRTIKRFAPHPVEMDKVLQIIQAGALAPSSGNMQNWNFVVITDIDKIRELYHHTLDQEPFLSAMAAVIVCGDVEYAHSMYGMRGKRLYTIQNCAASIQNMLLAAHAIGVGSCWIGAFDEDKVATMFNIPSHRHRPQAIILLGYAAEEPEPKTTKPLADLVFFNMFGNRVLRPHLIFYDWATEWRKQAKNVKEHSQSVWHRMLPKKSDDSTAAPDANGNGPEGSNADRAVPKRSHLDVAREHVRQRLESLKRDEYKP